jgi:hypothetical protein
MIADVKVTNFQKSHFQYLFYQRAKDLYSHEAGRLCGMGLTPRRSCSEHPVKNKTAVSITPAVAIHENEYFAILYA